ncbi:MAG: AraC family transcriptional regulator [Oscillospiraceae bacterium]|nr:AraC family transcriptional regulator [Oscillospiraceae bacterium]
MILHNVGYDHHHDADFFINRPNGSGDYLLLILKSDAIFTFNGEDVLVPKKSFFLYPPGMPQQYRCVPQHTFTNDWIHFQFEHEEATWFQHKSVPIAKPVQLEYTEFFSYCIKAIADENCSSHLHKSDSISHYFWLLCNKVSEQLHENNSFHYSAKHEQMLTIRNKIYTAPYLEWSVEWASHEIRMSRSSFQHHYKEQFGVTFIQDLIASRTARAKMLLCTTNMSVQDIGSQCGYRNYEHFERQFRNQCGISPSEFRKFGIP